MSRVAEELYESPSATEVDPSWIEELSEFIRIPSVSSDPARAGDVRAAAEWVRSFVQALGGSCAVVPAGRHPLVLGEIAASAPFSGAPTVLVYGHVDVQAAGPDSAWDSAPFEPAVREGWLYGRGAADDKGNLYLVLKAVEQLASERSLPVNVRLVCDGEEEIVGASIVDFVLSDEGPADACLIFDGAMVRRGVPAFYIGTRGLAYFHLRLRTGSRDLHSGLFGGAALNAAHALVRLLAPILDVPEDLRAGCRAPTPEELSSWETLDPGQDVLSRQGAAASDESAASSFYERTLAQPAIEVAGLSSGEPSLQKNIMPAEAEANVQIRLAPGQDVEDICAAFERHLHAAVPAGAELELERWAATPGALVAPDAPAVTLARDAFERALRTTPVLVRSGGTLPILAALARRAIPTVLTGFDLPEGNIHAPNERLLLAHLPLGVSAARETLLAFAALPKADNHKERKER